MSENNENAVDKIRGSRYMKEDQVKEEIDKISKIYNTPKFHSFIFSLANTNDRNRSIIILMNYLNPIWKLQII